MSEQFTIPRRPGWGAGITVTIECDPLASMGVKLGLAVRVARDAGANLARADLTGAYLGRADLAGADLTRADLTGANLAGADLAGAYLTGADLAGAYLTGADLTGADLTGAYLAGAYLAGAIIRGDKITRLVAQAVRLTPGEQYTFYGFELETGGVKIHAGCRWFTIPEFRAHVVAEYPGTPKAEETLAIIDFIERRAVSVGAIKPDEPAPKKPRARAAKEAA